jgi:hypothetical protein
MSLEQAEGKMVDTRSDIFSLGIVFYEMLTGERPFAGSSAVAIVSSILRDTPRQISELQPGLPRELVRLVHRCLAKDPINRYQSAIDLRHGLEETKQDVDSGDALCSSPANEAAVERLPLTIVAAALVAIAAASGWSEPREPRVRRPRLQNAVQVTSSLTWRATRPGLPTASASPIDGKDGYNYVGDHDIWVAKSAAAAGESDEGPASERSNAQLVARRTRDRILRIATAAGDSTPWPLLADSRLYSLIARNLRSQLSAAVVRDGTQLFVSVKSGAENAVILHPNTGNDARRCRGTTRFHRDLTSADGRRFAYAEGGRGGTEVTRLWTIPASGGEPVSLTDGRTNVRSPTWSKDGHKVFYVSNRGASMDLWQQVLAEDGRPVGEPLALTQGLGIRSAAFSPDGQRLAYSRGAWVANVVRVPIRSDRPATWADAQAVTAEHAYIEFIDLSPDGKLLAVSSDRLRQPGPLAAAADGWRNDTADDGRDARWEPRWSPDGRNSLHTYRSGNRDVWPCPHAVVRRGRSRHIPHRTCGRRGRPMARDRIPSQRTRNGAGS